MNKALLLSFIFVAVFSSAFAFSNNSSGYYSKGIIVGGADNNNSSGYYNTFIITEQPIGQGATDGYYSYVGFYPLLNMTYYVPFSNATFTFHCNPDSVDLGNSIICTGNLIDKITGIAINNAHIDWIMYDYNGTSYQYGDFNFVGNGVYNFRVNIVGNYTAGDYYFIFHSAGFSTDYSFPFYLAINFFMSNATMFFTLTMIVLATVLIIFGYWRRVMNFVIFGGFTFIIVAMYMFLNPAQFGALISNAFGVIFTLTGLMFLLSMFFEKWRESKDEKEREQEGG